MTDRTGTRQRIALRHFEHRDRRKTFASPHLVDAAVVLAIPEGTVQSRLRRGRDLLREALTELAASERADSTLTSIEGWAEELRDKVLGPKSA